MSLLARNNRLSAVTAPAGAAEGASVNALLGQGASFEGKLVFEGTVHINGKFKGEIRSDDTLVVGEGAHVEGQVHVGTLVVTGDVEGDVHADVVDLRAPARVRGAVYAKTLMIEKGVTFDGTSHMTPAEVAEE